MSEPAKDEADLVECMAKAMQDSVYRGQSKWEYTSKVERYYREAEAEAALTAIRAAGWAVVPVEPTDKMLEAVLRADWASHTDLLWADGYRIMLAAAPGVKP
jgi:hypothetical protein